jgi:hypothetical protein
MCGRRKFACLLFFRGSWGFDIYCVLSVTEDDTLQLRILTTGIPLALLLPEELQPSSLPGTVPVASLVDLSYVSTLIYKRNIGLTRGFWHFSLPPCPLGPYLHPQYA